MSEKVEIRRRDSVAKMLLPAVEDLYSGLDSSWFRFVPQQFQSSGYSPNRLIVTAGRNERPKLNIPCYKQVSSSKVFLGIINTSTPNGDIEIETFLAEVPEDGVIEMQHGTHGCPERQTVAEETVRSDDKKFLDVISETINIMSSLCERLESKGVKELIFISVLVGLLLSSFLIDLPLYYVTKIKEKHRLIGQDP